MTAPAIFDLSPPPVEADALDMLKWMVAVMDRDDRSLMFVASLLTQCIEWNGLTEKQAAAGSRVYERVLSLFDRGLLAIQGGRVEDDGAPSNVTHLTLKRGA
jgi:hypothetical protein